MSGTIMLSAATPSYDVPTALVNHFLIPFLSLKDLAFLSCSSRDWNLMAHHQKFLKNAMQNEKDKKKENQLYVKLIVALIEASEKNNWRLVDHLIATIPDLDHTFKRQTFSYPIRGYFYYDNLTILGIVATYLSGQTGINTINLLLRHNTGPHNLNLSSEYEHQRTPHTSSAKSIMSREIHAFLSLKEVEKEIKHFLILAPIEEIEIKTKKEQIKEKILTASEACPSLTVKYLGHILQQDDKEQHIYNSVLQGPYNNLSQQYQNANKEIFMSGAKGTLCGLGLALSLLYACLGPLLLLFLGHPLIGLIVVGSVFASFAMIGFIAGAIVEYRSQKYQPLIQPTITESRPKLSLYKGLFFPPAKKSPSSTSTSSKSLCNSFLTL